MSIKFSELPVLDGVDLADDDIFAVVDVSAGVSKKVTRADLAPVVTIASQVDAETGTNNTDLMTPLRTAQAIDAQERQVGVGQTWTDVTASRSYGTTYQNLTGKPIMLGINTSNNSVSTTTYDFQKSSDGATWVGVVQGVTTNGLNNGFSGLLLVQINQYYRIVKTGPNTAAIASWMELI